ncbi:MAG: BMP family ABC transporter substrate-binding protein [Candidatus Excrementavichristensenella sp.]
MSHLSRALNQFDEARASALRYVRACSHQGLYPYLQVLDEIFDESAAAGRQELGLIDIPMELIAGTKTSGRRSAFAGNYMPLLERHTEFGMKWIALCAAHLGDTGISDPIYCFEYMRRFYVQEGNKRVSVLKSYGSLAIPGSVTRIIPPYSSDREVMIYYEFMDFFKLNRMYQVYFSQLGGFARLQAALGMQPDQKWTQDERRNFLSDYHRFREAFEKQNREGLQVTPGDALLIWLAVYPFSSIAEKTNAELLSSLESIWPDVRLLAQGQPISMSTATPKDKERSLLSGLFGGPRQIHAAFIYAHDLEESVWSRAHEQGRRYLDRKLAGQVTTTAYFCGEDADGAMEQAMRDGAQVLFVTSANMIPASRRFAAKNPNIKIFVCALSIPYAGIRSYYCRIYEAKYIAGAIAGAMARDPRIGYIADYPIMGVPAAINAFALGARMTNPAARVCLKWSCLPGSPTKAFEQEGIALLSGQDAAGNPGHELPEFGIYRMDPDGRIITYASPRWDWGTFYYRIVSALLEDTLDRNRNAAVNYWWGIQSGVVSVDLTDDLPEGVRHLAEILRYGITTGQVDPFRCHFRDVDGKLINDGTRSLSIQEISEMDYLVEGVRGEIPAFDQLRPISRELVRILGIYRDSIPPELEEKQL